MTISHSFKALRGYIDTNIYIYIYTHPETIFNIYSQLLIPNNQNLELIHIFDPHEQQRGIINNQGRSPFSRVPIR